MHDGIILEEPSMPFITMIFEETHMLKDDIPTESVVLPRRQRQFGSSTISDWTIEDWTKGTVMLHKRTPNPA